MATQLLRFLGEGLGIFKTGADDESSGIEEKIEGKIETKVEAPVQAALLLKKQALPAKPSTMSRSVSETLYEDLGRIHSMQAVRKALDISGRGNAMHTRVVLEQNPIDYNRYCCVDVQDESKYPSECALCLMDFDAADLLRLPCGIQTCRTCLQDKIVDDIRSGGRPMCPGQCEKRLMPGVVASSMSGLCGLCGGHLEKGLKRAVACCASHEFCAECLVKHVKRSIQLKLSPMCPRSRECHYTLAVPEVKSILEHSARTSTPETALDVVRLMRTYFSQIVPPHVAGYCSPFACECLSPLCSGRLALPDAAVVARLTGARGQGVGSCKRCRHDWCLSCAHVAHPGISCAAAERMAGKWQEFMTERPLAFQHCDLARALRARYEEDKMTADIVRRCPHCKKGPIYRIDGCDAMICGSDAPDKRSSTRYGHWSRYRGCGRSFQWRDALRCRPAACHGKPAGSLALAESCRSPPFETFFQERLTDEDTDIAMSLITLGYLPAQPDILAFACKRAPCQDTAVGLIAAKADIHAGDAEGESPLLLACAKQWPECVLALVAAKATVTCRRADGKTPLLLACSTMCNAGSGRPDVLSALLAAGADATECLPNDQSPLLLACATAVDAQCVSVLASAGAPVNVRRKDGQTPLLLACAHNSAGAVANLLHAKADSNMGAAGRTPLLVACAMPNPCCIQPLLEAKANVLAKDPCGRTAFDLIGQHSKASMRQRRDSSCVRALVRAEAHVSVDHGDWQVLVHDRAAFVSALELAGDDATIVHNNCLDAVAALLQANADCSGRGSEVAVLSLNLAARRTRPLQRLLAVSESEDSFQLRFGFAPQDHRASVRLSMRQMYEAGPSDSSDARALTTANADRHDDSERIVGSLHRNTPHGKAAGRRFARRHKRTSKTYGSCTGVDDKRRPKHRSKPKRAWKTLRGKRMYHMEWSRTGDPSTCK